MTLSALSLALATLCLIPLLLPSFTSATATAAAPVITRVLQGYTVPYTAGMPEQIAVDHLDNVYCLDFENNHIAQFAANGTFLRSFTVDSPPLKGPTGLAVDSALSVYVADSDNARIVKWDSTGAVVSVYSGAVYDSVAVDREGFIYAFVNGSPVRRMAQNGTTLQSYTVNTTSGWWNRGSVAIDCGGQLLVADMGNGAAYRIDVVTGATLNVWTTTNPKLNYPWNIAGNCRGDVLIADAFNARVVQLDNQNNMVAVYAARPTGYGVAFDSKGRVFVAPGGGFNVAIMDAPKENKTVADAAVSVE